jgi:hypothetical protein
MNDIDMKPRLSWKIRRQDRGLVQAGGQPMVSCV